LGEDQTRVSRLRLGDRRRKPEGGEKSKEGRKDAQVSLLLWKTTLGFSTEDNEGTGGVIIANRGILEGRS
jgi:hypothetical protein